MSDPRSTATKAKSANHSELMTALLEAIFTKTVVNRCPFGCSDDQLDQHGFCGHLVGFYNGGQTFEPRVVRKKDKRIVVDGTKRQPMKQGYRLVRITTTARVYSPTPVKELCVSTHEYDAVMAEIWDKEQKLIAAAEAVRNPVLEGVWGETLYDVRPEPPLAPPA